MGNLWRRPSLVLRLRYSQFHQVVPALELVRLAEAAGGEYGELVSHVLFEKWVNSGELEKFLKYQDSGSYWGVVLKYIPALSFSSLLEGLL